MFMMKVKTHFTNLNFIFLHLIKLYFRLFIRKFLYDQLNFIFQQKFLIQLFRWSFFAKLLLTVLISSKLQATPQNQFNKTEPNWMWICIYQSSILLIKTNYRRFVENSLTTPKFCDNLISLFFKHKRRCIESGFSSWYF